jgi:hypothetical protein
MNSRRKLDRDFAQADIAAVSSLLSQLSDEDVMSRFGLEARLEELRQNLAQIEVAEDQPRPQLLFSLVADLLSALAESRASLPALLLPSSKISSRRCWHTRRVD